MPGRAVRRALLLRTLYAKNGRKASHTLNRLNNIQYGLADSSVSCTDEHGELAHSFGLAPGVAGGTGLAIRVCMPSRRVNGFGIPVFRSM